MPQNGAGGALGIYASRQRRCQAPGASCAGWRAIDGAVTIGYDEIKQAKEDQIMGISRLTEKQQQAIEFIFKANMLAGDRVTVRFDGGEYPIHPATFESLIRRDLIYRMGVPSSIPSPPIVSKIYSVSNVAITPKAFAYIAPGIAASLSTALGVVYGMPKIGDLVPVGGRYRLTLNYLGATKPRHRAAVLYAWAQGRIVVDARHPQERQDQVIFKVLRHP